MHDSISLPLEGDPEGGSRAACLRSEQAVSPLAKWHGSNQRFEARHLSPGGHNAEGVSDPEDGNRNEDLARQCQRRRLRLRKLSLQMTDEV